MILKSSGFKLAVAILIGVIVFILPRPEGTKFKLSGTGADQLSQSVSQYFSPQQTAPGKPVILTAKAPGTEQARAQYLTKQAKAMGLSDVNVDYVDGMSPKAKRFLSVLAVLVILFVVEPIPLEITAVLIGASLVILGITDVKGAWAPYMHPVVIFIMCCLIFAIALDKVGLTKRLGYYIIKKAGNSVTRFTFIIAIGLGLASSFMHDAAACAIGIVTMLPLMRAVGIEPNTNTAKFMMLSLPFACSCGGMGTLVGGGRCMVSAAFLKEFTGIEITFFDWIKYCMPAAIICVPAAVLLVYMVYRPDPNFKLPDFDEDLGPMTAAEKKALIVIAISFVSWLTKGIHGLHYSVTGMVGVTCLVLLGVLKWRDINDNLEWGTALFIFGGGISLGLAMGLFRCGRLLCQPVLPADPRQGVAGALCGRRCVRCPGYQCHGQCGGGSTYSAHCYPHGSTGRGESHDSGLRAWHGHLICHAAGHRLSAQCHCLFIQIFQVLGSDQAGACDYTCAFIDTDRRGMCMVEGFRFNIGGIC